MTTFINCLGAPSVSRERRWVAGLCTFFFSHALGTVREGVGASRPIIISGVASRVESLSSGLTIGLAREGCKHTSGFSHGRVLNGHCASSLASVL